MIRIRKILGRAEMGGVQHCVAKLENDRYAVGQLTEGQAVEADVQFETLDAAFNCWLATYAHAFQIRAASDNGHNSAL